MRLSTHSDYALRLLMALAVEPEATRSVAEVADAYGISANHLAKVTVRLVLGGWVESRRGRGGGLKLAMNPEAITVGSVVRSTEVDFALLECFDSERDTCVISRACALKPHLARAQEAFFESLDHVTLAELVPNRTRLKRLLML